jgi:hypothetical protein
LPLHPRRARLLTVVSLSAREGPDLHQRCPRRARWSSCCCAREGLGLRLCPLKPGGHLAFAPVRGEAYGTPRFGNAFFVWAPSGTGNPLPLFKTRVRSEIWYQVFAVITTTIRLDITATFSMETVTSRNLLSSQSHLKLAFIGCLQRE